MTSAYLACQSPMVHFRVPLLVHPEPLKWYLKT